MTISLITDTSVLTKRIAEVGKSSMKLQAQIHVLACSAIAHADKHGDVYHVNSLYNALGAGVRKSALTAWYVAFGKVEANTDKDSKADLPFVFAKGKSTNMDDAMANPFYDFTPDKAPDAVLDVGKLLAGLIRKMDKAAKDGTPIEGLSAEQIKALRNVTMIGQVAGDLQDSGLVA